MSSERRQRLHRHEELKRRLERLLYDYDPEGMGSTVGAPLDEYSDVATSLMRTLRDRLPDTAFAESVWDVVPGATAELVAQIEKAWKESLSR